VMMSGLALMALSLPEVQWRSVTSAPAQAKVPFCRSFIGQRLHPISCRPP